MKPRVDHTELFTQPVLQTLVIHMPQAEVLPLTPLTQHWIRLVRVFCIDTLDHEPIICWAYNKVLVITNNDMATGRRTIDSKGRVIHLKGIGLVHLYLTTDS